MPVELEIVDGEPWWLSPNVWVVPGNNPEGSPGTPIAGQSAFMWARVANNGRSSVSNAAVRFYWANPSAGFNRNSAHLVGTSFVNLAPGETADVLCLMPWVPEYVNEGHECILAEAYHETLDPLPSTLGFNVPTDRHVAQRNLSVHQAAASGMFMMQVMFYNPMRVAREFVLRIEQGDLAQLKALGKSLDRGKFESQGKLVVAAFTDQRCPTNSEGNESLQVKIPAKGAIAKTLSGKVEGGAALIHVTQHSALDAYCGKAAGGQTIGGLSLLVLEPQRNEGPKS